MLFGVFVIRHRLPRRTAAERGGQPSAEASGLLTTSGRVPLTAQPYQTLPTLLGERRSAPPVLLPPLTISDIGKTYQMIGNNQGSTVHDQQRKQPQGGQQGSTKNGDTDPEETKVGGSKMEATKTGNVEKRQDKAIEEKDEQQRGGDADNPSEYTGATESGSEDKGAKR